MADTPKKSSAFGTLWRLLTVGGLLVGVNALFSQKQEEEVKATGKPTTPPSRQALEAGYEEKDINVRATSWILFGIGCTVAVVVGISFLMVWRENVNNHAAWSRLSPQQTAVIVPPAPRVQRIPFADLASVRAREERLLHSYGWTSADHSTARIPIGRAMALVVGKSLDYSP